MRKYRKSIAKVLLVTIVLTAGISLSAYAAEWKQSNGQWWYQNDDGSYPKDESQWIDGNGDGISELYYFDKDGWLLVNTTHYGNPINENGQVIDPYSGEPLILDSNEEKSIVGVFFENGTVYDYLHNGDASGKCICIMPVWTNNVMDGTYRLTVDQETGVRHFRWVYTFQYLGNNQDLIAEIKEGPGGNLVISFDGKDTITIQDGSEKSVYIRPEYGDMEENAEEDNLYFSYWNIE